MIYLTYSNDEMDLNFNSLGLSLCIEILKRESNVHM